MHDAQDVTHLCIPPLPAQGDTKNTVFYLHDIQKASYVARISVYIREVSSNLMPGKKGKVHPCTSSEDLYRSYGP